MLITAFYELLENQRPILRTFNRARHILRGEVKRFCRSEVTARGQFTTGRWRNKGYFRTKRGLMMRRIRTEMTFESDERMVIRGRRKAVQASCPVCGDQAAMITLEEAVMLARVSSRVIHRWAEAGQIHFSDTADGFLTVCMDSLRASLSA